MKTLREKHTSSHAALATAVRTIIEIDHFERVGHFAHLSPELEDKRSRMWAEVDRWKGTEDMYALGIMAPLRMETL